MKNQTDEDDLPPLSVTEATVEKARKLVAEMLAQSARKKMVAANEHTFGEEDTHPETVPVAAPSLPYTDRDDDTLVRDENGEWVMKKYQDL